jgi:nucleotide-binding universal stress UspA family protein
VDALIVSAALDTNGQNQRYVRASEKWGTDEGVLKALSVGEYDPASVVGRFQAAADKYGELKIRSVHRATHIYQQMPADIEWTRTNDSMIRDLADEADIIHLNNSWRPWQKLRFSRRKPMLLHHHGSLFRQQTKDLLNWAYRNHAVQAVSTVDLLRVAPQNLHWLPTAYDVGWLQEFGKAHREPNGRILVVSAPTNRQYKSTALLEAAVAQLQGDGLPVDLLIIEGKPWAECMALKASADIYFDQVILGYGCNAVEAWGMGIPVIAGADEWTLAKMREVYGSEELPFYEATEDTIGAAIADLAQHPRKRAAYAKRGLAHVRKFHDERPALTRLAQLYHMAIEWSEKEAPAIQPVLITFRAAVPQVRAAGRFVTFTDGIYSTDNPYLATALRLLAQRYPRYGIEEVA